MSIRCNLITESDQVLLNYAEEVNSKDILDYTDMCCVSNT